MLFCTLKLAEIKRFRNNDFHFIRERVQNTTRSKLEEKNIDDLQPDKVYHFRVLAFNSLGPGLSSDSLTVTTQSEEHVPSSPLFFIAYPTSSRSVHVSWKQPEDPKGFIDRYKIYYMEVNILLFDKYTTTFIDTNVLFIITLDEYFN